jgi:hypothetical protein
VQVAGDNSFFLVCQGLASCTVTATYTDAVWGTFTTTSTTTRTATAALSSATAGASGGGFVIGETVRVTVTDADLDADPTTTEGITATINPGSVPVSLTETGVTTGVFTGTVNTRSSQFPVGMTTGVGPLSGGSSLVVTYADTSPVGHTATASMVGDSRAIITSLPLPATHANTWPGTAGALTNAAVAITITDIAQKSAASSVIASVSVFGATLTPPGPLTVTLDENGPGSGIYTGSILTTSDASSTIALPYNGLEDWSYFVRYAQPGVATAVRPTLYRRRARDASIALQPSASIRAGALLLITVVDVDADIDWTLRDTVQVVVSSDKRHESSETVTLTERTINSGVFTGTLPTSPSQRAGGPNDGSINVVAGNTLTATYTDLYSADGSQRARTASVSVTAEGTQASIAIVDIFRANAATYLINEGNVINVLVNDTDSAASQGYVEVSCGGGTPEVLNMSNMSTSVAGTFIGAFMTTTLVGGSAPPGAIQGCIRGSEVKATYFDVLPFGTMSTYAVMNRPAILSASPQPIGLSQSLRITVTDDDLNVSPSSADTGVVEVRSSRTAEGTESVILTETGLSTGVFTGETRTLMSEMVSSRDSGGLYVSEGDYLTVEYQERALGSRVVDAFRKRTVSVLVGKRATMSLNEVLQAGESLQITVTDLDLPLTAVTNGSAYVDVTTSKDQEIERVVLTATGPGLTVFTGVLPTCTRCTSATGCQDLCLQQPCACLTPPCVMNCPSELQVCRCV